MVDLFWRCRIKATVSEAIERLERYRRTTVSENNTILLTQISDVLALAMIVDKHQNIFDDYNKKFEAKLLLKQASYHLEKTLTGCVMC